MRYKEAESLCEGQEFAMEMPLKALPRRRPDPEQEAFVWCKAPVIAKQAGAWTGYPDREHVEIHISYGPDPNAHCRFSKPDCANCPVAEIALKAHGKTVTITREQHKRNDLSSFNLKT